MGNGLPAITHALALCPNGDIVAGGRFGDVRRWNGSSWVSTGWWTRRALARLASMSAHCVGDSSQNADQDRPRIHSRRSGASSMTLQVDYGENGDLQDRLDWIEPILIHRR
jgi:hypothetical protein